MLKRKRAVRTEPQDASGNEYSRPCRSQHRLRFAAAKKALENELKELKTLLRKIASKTGRKRWNRRLKPSVANYHKKAVEEKASSGSQSKKVAFGTSKPRFSFGKSTKPKREDAIPGKTCGSAPTDAQIKEQSKIELSKVDLTQENNTVMKTFGQGVYVCKWQKFNEERRERRRRLLAQKKKAAYGMVTNAENDNPRKSMWKVARRPLTLATGSLKPSGGGNYKFKNSILNEQPEKSAKVRVEAPGPGSYNLPQWPLKPAPSNVPFNSTTTRQITIKSDVPPVGSYNVDSRDVIGRPIDKHGTWGGTQTIKLATMIRCSDEPYDWCVLCQIQPQGDYFYSEEHGPLCRSCYKSEKFRHSTFNNLQMESFKPARHCAYMHFHDAHYNVFTTMKNKDIRNEISREAYLARYQETRSPKMRTIDEPDRVNWFAKRKATTFSRKYHPEIPEMFSQIPWTEIGASKFTYGLGKGKLPPSWDTVELQSQIKEAEKFKKEMISAMEEKSDYDQEDAMSNSYGDKAKKSEIEMIKKWRIKRYGNMAKYYNTLLPDFHIAGLQEDVDYNKRNYWLAPKADGYWRLLSEESKQQIDQKTDELMTCEDKMKKLLKVKTLELINYAQNAKIRELDHRGLSVEEQLHLITALPEITDDIHKVVHPLNLPRQCVPCDYDVNV